MNDSPILIAPSILAADFANLARDIARVEAAGADWLHVDVMDGHFVPNISIGPPVVESVHRAATIPLDVHLMIDDPLTYAEPFARAGAHVLTFHWEATGPDRAREVIERYRELEVPKVGIAVNPDTPVEPLEPFFSDLDLILVMSVQPGFGGQSFRPEVLTKTAKLRSLGFRGHVEMDGGVDPATGPRCAAAGADVLVSGSAIFGSNDLGGTIAALRARSADAARTG